MELKQCEEIFFSKPIRVSFHFKDRPCFILVEYYVMFNADCLFCSCMQVRRLGCVRMSGKNV